MVSVGAVSSQVPVSPVGGFDAVRASDKVPNQAAGRAPGTAAGQPIPGTLGGESGHDQGSATVKPGALATVAISYLDMVFRQIAKFDGHQFDRTL